MDIMKDFESRLKIQNPNILQSSQHLIDRLNDRCYKPNTIQHFITLARKSISTLIADKDLREQAFKILSMDKKESHILKTKYLSGILKIIYLKRAPFINFIRKFLEKDLKTVGIIEYTIFLLLVSGRRRYEIMSIGEFAHNDTIKSPNIILFKGSAKTEYRRNVQYKIPCIVNNHYFLKAFQIYRNRFNTKTKSCQELNIQYSKPITDYVKLQFDNSNLLCRDLRRIYAAITYEKYKGDLCKFDYYRKILGHHENSSVETTICYMNVAFL